VVVENVVQNPTVAYTCTGTTLSFTSAPPTGTNNIYVVHLGPPAATIAPPTTINNNTTFTGGVSLKNETPEDTDGGRESKVTFKGLQSGEEESTLAEIQASHDGTSDDEKGDLIFKTNDGSDGTSPTEAMRIQSDQSILFGSPTTDDDQKFQMIKTSGSVGLGLHSNRAAAGGSALILSHNRNNAIGSFTALNDEDQLGRITFQGCDGTDIKTEGAQIHAEINGTVGSNDLPTDLVFSTTADGASSITDRMRLTRDGWLEQKQAFVCTASATQRTTFYNSGNGLGLYAAGAYSSCGDHMEIGCDATAGWANIYLAREWGTGEDERMITFNVNQVQRGVISSNTSGTTYGVSSDYRMKENVSDVTDGITRVKQLKPKRFNFIDDEENTLIDGFIAHEAQTVVPESVTGTKDKVDDEGNPVYQAIDQSKIVPLLTAALKEAIAKIETLETKVAALEAE
jgi:hypothetical protein